MIYIIGGAPRCGKTKLAQKLSKKLNIPIFSTDQLRKDILKCTPCNKIDIKFPFEKMFQGDKVDDFFANYTARDILNADLREARSIWKIIKNFIEDKILLNQDYIIEGVHLLPKYVTQLPKLSKKLKILYIGKIDTNKILQGLRRNTDKNDWILGHIYKQRSLLKAAEMVRLYSKYFLREAKKHHFKFVNTEDDFHKKLKNNL